MLGEGEILEVDPPRRLVQTMVALWSDEVKSEGASRITWEIEPIGDSCRLTVTHDQLREGANDQLYGGWPMILSGLKTWLETGELLTTPGSIRLRHGVGIRQQGSGIGCDSLGAWGLGLSASRSHAAEHGCAVQFAQRILPHPASRRVLGGGKALRHGERGLVERGVALAGGAQRHVHGLLHVEPFVGGGAFDERQPLQEWLVAGGSCRER